MMKNSNLAGTVLRYGVVGISVALVYLAAFALLERIALLHSVINSALAFIVAVIFQYIAQGAFTFRRPLNDSKQIMRFVTTVAMGLAISTWMVGYLAPAFGISNFVASLIVVVTLPVFNLVAFMFWVFVGKAEKMV